MANKVDSNITGLAFAEETSLKVLPGTPVWYGLEPNSYSDLGGELSKMARAPIDPSRQNKKGTITDLDASGGFNIDVTQNNLTRLLQGFFFADVREKPTTKPMNGTAVTLTGVVSSTKTFSAASGLLTFNKAGYLVNATGFSTAGNNGLKTIASATATAVVISESLTDETPTSAAKLSVVGFQFPSADVAISVTGNIPTLTSVATDLTTLGLIVGEWMFIGGDVAATTFANNVGFARIKSIAAHAIVFDDTTFASVTEAGTGKTIRIFFGTVLKNENTTSLIKRKTYNIERQLGYGISTTEVQAEYLEGAVANEFTLNIPQADKLNADLSFVACDNTYVSGDTGDLIKSGTRVAALGEDAFNTSSDIYRIKMSLLDPTDATPTALFGYVSEATITINNNVTPNKAVGVLGAFDTSAGNFDVGGSITAYFSTVSAVQAVRANSDIGINTITCAKNAGFIYDIPLLSLGGGRLNVEKDNPITVPLESSGAQNAAGYTLLHNKFDYLPTVAMPQ